MRESTKAGLKTAGTGLFFLVLCVGVGIFFYKINPAAHGEAPSTSPTVTVTKTVIVESTPTPTPTAEVTSEEPDADAKFGQTIHLDEGIRVTVAVPKDYPKDPTVKMSKKHYKFFLITVKNTTKKTIPRIEEWWVDSTGGTFTLTEGNGQPEGKLAPGESVTFGVVFGYDEAGPVDLKFMTTPLYEVSKQYTWA